MFFISVVVPLNWEKGSRGLKPKSLEKVSRGLHLEGGNRALVKGF